MALPPSSHPCWLKLARGGLERVPTQQLGVKLLSKRLSGSPEMSELEKAADVHRFFAKFERILGPEIQFISKL